MSTNDRHYIGDEDELLPDQGHARDVLWYALGGSAAAFVFGGIQMAWFMPSHVMTAMGAVGLLIGCLTLVMTDV